MLDTGRTSQGAQEARGPRKPGLRAAAVGSASPRQEAHSGAQDPQKSWRGRARRQRGVREMTKNTHLPAQESPV